MSRSHSFSTPSSLSSPTTPRDTRLHNRLPSIQVVSRDLSKEMFDAQTGMFPVSRDTPPATPDSSPVRRKHSDSSPPVPVGDFPSRYAPPSPPATASLYAPLTFYPTSAWSEDQQQEILSDALGMEPLGPGFADLQIGEQFAPYEIPAHEQDYFDSKYGAGTPHHAEHTFPSQTHSLESIYDDGCFDSPLASPYIHPHHHLGPDQRPFDHAGQFDEWGNSLPLTASPSELQQSTSNQASQYSYFPASYGSSTSLSDLARPELLRQSSSTSSFLPSPSSSYPHSPLTDPSPTLLPPASFDPSHSTPSRSSHHTTLAPAIELPYPATPYRAYTTLKPPTLSSSYASSPFLATLAAPRRMAGSASCPSGFGSAGASHPTSDLMDVDRHGRACLPEALGTSLLS